MPLMNTDSGRDEEHDHDHGDGSHDHGGHDHDHGHGDHDHPAVEHEATVERVGSRVIMEIIVAAEDVGVGKPDPEVFLYACRALGVEPAEAVVIGDSDNDARGARAAGCAFLLVPYGYREGRDVHEVECDGIVPTLFHAAREILGPASTAKT